MFSIEELIKSQEYWMETLQNELFRQVKAYMEKEKINQSELAIRLGVTKGYVSQVLNGNFNYSLQKLIEISLAIGIAPRFQFQNLESYIEEYQNKLMQYSGEMEVRNKPYSLPFIGRYTQVRSNIHGDFLIECDKKNDSDTKIENWAA